MSMHYTAIATLASHKHWPADICVQLADLFKKEEAFCCDTPAFKHDAFLRACGLVLEGDMWVRL